MYDIPDGSAKVISNCLHEHFRFFQAKITEKHAIERIVIVLASVGKDRVKILSAFGDNCRKANDLRSGSHKDQKLQLPVMLKRNVRII